MAWRPQGKTSARGARRRGQSGAANRVDPGGRLCETFTAEGAIPTGARMKVFVTGAGGFVGRSVVARLAAEGHAVRALLRPPSARALFRAESVETVEGDVTDRAAMTAAARGAEAAIHLVGILRERGADTFEAVHVAGTENVAAACRAAGARRLVYVSALGVGRGPDVPYLASKAAAEERVRGSGLDWTILRPSIIHGPRGDFMVAMARMVARPGPVPLVGSGKQTIQPVWVEDVARVCAGALARDGTIGRTYDVAGPEVMHLATFYRTLARVLLRRAKWCVPVPTVLVRLGARVAVRLLKDPPVTPDELAMLLAARPCDIRPMCEAFDLEPTALETALTLYAGELKAAAGLA